MKSWACCKKQNWGFKQKCAEIKNLTYGFMKIYTDLRKMYCTGAIWFIFAISMYVYRQIKYIYLITNKGFDCIIFFFFYIWSQSQIHLFEISTELDLFHSDVEQWGLYKYSIHWKCDKAWYCFNFINPFYWRKMVVCSILFWQY